MPPGREREAREEGVGGREEAEADAAAAEGVVVVLVERERAVVVRRRTVVRGRIIFAFWFFLGGWLGVFVSVWWGF